MIGYTANISSALLLNSGYEPLRVVSWQRAFVLVFQDKAEVLEEYTEHINTVRRKFSVPAVIRLRTWVRMKRWNTFVRFSRANLYARDEYTCQYCWMPHPERELTLDHVTPVLLGGKKSWENIVTACKECNQSKGHKTVEEAGLQLLKKPKAPRWLPGMVGQVRTKSPHILWEPYLQKNK